MNIVQVNKSEIKDALLSCRANRQVAARSIVFLAVAPKSEAGVLVFDDWSDRSLGYVLEINVLPDFREQGVGSALLAHTEVFARSLNCSMLELKAYSLDLKQNSNSSLIEWYQRRGYRLTGGEKGSMEKCLTRASEDG